jgi:hypothetical protein
MTKAQEYAWQAKEMIEAIDAEARERTQKRRARSKPC